LVLVDENKINASTVFDAAEYVFMSKTNLGMEFGFVVRNLKWSILIPIYPRAS